ncbi:MAG: LOG family protein [Planctomycetes bacterium]|nr:LOG family protein [Planctomycetota bacterium]
MKMKIKIGVMGSASGPTLQNPHAIRMARALGRAIAERDCILINGACPGLPDHAAHGARRAGGFVFGVSPAFSRREHLETYRSPIKHYDLLLFSGLGLMERDIINIRSADAIVIVGGGIGTLNEFTVAYEEKKIVGVLTGTGGLSDHIPEVLAACDRKLRPDALLFESDPVRLIDGVLRAIKSYEPPTFEHQIGGEREAKPAPRETAVPRLRRQKRKHDREM